MPGSDTTETAGENRRNRAYNAISGSHKANQNNNKHNISRIGI